MKKPQFNFKSLIKKVKSRLTSLIPGRHKKLSDEFIDEFEENYEVEQYEDEDYEDETNPSFTPLSIESIKKEADSEAPPELPAFDSADDLEGTDDLSDDETHLDATSPSIREFNVPTQKKSFKQKVQDFSKNLGTKLSSKSESSTKGTAPKGAFTKKVLKVLRSVNYDEIFDNIYSPQSRPKIHQIFLIVLFIGSSYITARLITTILAPLPNTKVAAPANNLKLNQQDVIKNKLARLNENDLFHAPEKSKTPVKVVEDKPKVKEPAVCDVADTKSSINLELLNTVILQDSVKSLASVQMRGKKKENFLRVGDQVPGILEVGSIQRRKIIFKNLKTRQCEYIESQKKGQRPSKPLNIVRSPKKAKKILNENKANGIDNEGNTYKIKKAVRERMLGNISEVLTQARAVQIKNPDGSMSFRMQEVVPGSIYTQLGIQEGDVISGINGKKITNMSELMNLFGQIDKIDHFELSVKRNGIEQDLEYNFE